MQILGHRKLGINDKTKLADFADDIMRHAEGSNIRSLRDGRTAYWDDATGTLVIHNPKHIDLGTIFRPKDGKRYFLNLD